MKTFAGRLLLSVAVAGLSAGTASAQSAANARAIRLISGFSQLGNTPEGRAVLAQNLDTAIRINNQASTAARNQAISDDTTAALIGGTSNGVNLADGLGPRLLRVYQTRNAAQPNFTSTSVSANVTALFSQMNALTTGGDSAVSKNFFANGTVNGRTPATGVALPDGGVFNVYDRAYNPSPANANTVGDSRPVQVAPDRIQAFSGPNYFGTPTNTASIYPTLKGNASFPSGHSAAGFTSSTLLAMMVPERYQQELTRGAEFGTSRIVLGAHYSLNVIGARIQTLYALSQALNNDPNYTGQRVASVLGVPITTTTDFRALFAAAQADVRGLLATCPGGIAACAAPIAGDRFGDAAKNKADYRYSLTYGLSPVGRTDLAPVVPLGAEVLIATRFPYLTRDQLRDVLASTEIASGQALDDGSGWARLNLYDAADGYGALTGQVTVTMDAAQGGFSAADRWNNDITGTGGLTKAGSGILTLTGRDSYAGPTIVNGGGLFVTGSIASATTVNTGAMFGGSGSVGAVTVNGGGMLLPGTIGTPGTLTVNGLLTLAAGSTLVEQVAGSAAGRVVVAGPATIGGTVQVIADAVPVQPVTRVSLIEASGGVTGTFASVTTGIAGLRAALDYAPNGVTLSLNRSDVDYRPLAVTANQRRVAAALTAALPAARTAGAATLLNSLYATATASTATGTAELDRLGGEGLADAGTVALFAGRTISNAIGDEQRATLRYDRLHLWGGPIGGREWIDGRSGDGTADLRGSTWGGLIGLDGEVAPGWRAGFGGGGLTTRSDTPARITSASVSSGHVGAYTSVALPEGSYLRGAIAYGHYVLRTHRSAGGVGQVAVAREDARYDGRELRLSAEVGHMLSAGAFAVTPFVAIDYARLTTDAFDETGDAALALHADRHTLTSLPLIAGVRLGREASVNPDGRGLRPYAELTYQRELRRDRGLDLRFVALDVGSFSISGAQPAGNAFVGRLGAELPVTGRLSLFANAGGTVSSVQRSVSGNGGLRVAF